MKINYYYAVLSKYDEGVVAEMPDIDDIFGEKMAVVSYKQASSSSQIDDHL